MGWHHCRDRPREAGPGGSTEKPKPTPGVPAATLDPSLRTAPSQLVPLTAGSLVLVRSQDTTQSWARLGSRRQNTCQERGLLSKPNETAAKGSPVSSEMKHPSRLNNMERGLT